MRWAAPLVAALALLTSCDGFPSGTHACTGIGTPVGVGVSVDPAAADGVTGATLTACWSGTCRTRPLDLRKDAPAQSPPPSSAPGLRGFADIDGLPRKPVRVTLVLRNRQGATVLDRHTTVTPELRYPNGRDCEGGGPQTRVRVTAEGALVPG